MNSGKTGTKRSVSETKRNSLHLDKIGVAMIVNPN